MTTGRWADDQRFDEGPIRVRVRTADELFNPVDPSPIEERALNTEIGDWIEEWAEDLDGRDRIAIEIYVDQPADESTHGAVRAAVHHHFDYRAWQTGRALHKLLRDGRTSLVLGISALIGFSLAAQLLGDDPTGIRRIVHEGLYVTGWVAMWKPLEIFLYQWWPMRRERHACRRLADAEITFTDQPGPEIKRRARIR